MTPEQIALMKIGFAFLAGFIVGSSLVFIMWWRAIKADERNEEMRKRVDATRRND